MDDIYHNHLCFADDTVKIRFSETEFERMLTDLARVSNAICTRKTFTPTSSMERNTGTHVRNIRDETISKKTKQTQNNT